LFGSTVLGDDLAPSSTPHGPAVRPFCFDDGQTRRSGVLSISSGTAGNDLVLGTEDINSISDNEKGRLARAALIFLSLVPA
jgi:hypothetical protein